MAEGQMDRWCGICRQLWWAIHLSITHFSISHFSTSHLSISHLSIQPFDLGSSIYSILNTIHPPIPCPKPHHSYWTHKAIIIIIMIIGQLYCKTNILPLVSAFSVRPLWDEGTVTWKAWDEKFNLIVWSIAWKVRSFQMCIGHLESC